MPTIMTLLRRYALKKRIYVKAEHGLMGILAAAVSRTPIYLCTFYAKVFLALIQIDLFTLTGFLCSILFKLLE
jgi:hypothetical protein